MDDQHSLRAAFSAPRNQRPVRAYVLRGSLSGLVVMSSVLVYDAFTEPALAVAEARMASLQIDAPAPALVVEASPALVDVLQPSLKTDAAESSIVSAESVAALPAGKEISVATAPADEIVDPPRIEVAQDERSVAPAAFDPADISEPEAPVVASAPAMTRPAEIASPVAVELAKAPVQPDQIALDAQISEMNVAMMAEPNRAPTAPDAPSVLRAPGQPVIDGERALVLAEISLSTPSAFDLEVDRGAEYAALVSPRLDAPSTPDLNVDPAASFGEPLDLLSAAPYARTPELKAPAVVAVLGAEPPSGFVSISAPGEVTIDYQDDLGREAARRSVMREGGEGWRRFAVAPPANPENLPVLAIVIDEVGAYGAPVEEVAALSPMVTTSVIPSTPDSNVIADQLRVSGREVLVHMPMETYADFKEGPRPILKRMTDQEVRETARWHLSQFTGFVGVNNHLGSRATRDQRVMDVLMAELAQRDLMFVDSRTTTKSLAEQAALNAGMLATRNHRFIDNEISVDAIMRELNAAAAMARRYGAAVALGNPHPATVRAVKRWMEIHDGENVLVAPITHVAGVLNAKSEDAIARR